MAAATELTIILEPVWPVPLIALLAAGVIVVTLFAYWKDAPRVGKGRVLALAACRLLGLAGLMWILLNPQKVTMEQPPTFEQSLVVAVDTSASMAYAANSGQSRLDAARQAIAEAGLVSNGQSALEGLSFQAFDRTARPIDAAELATLVADGRTTTFHRSINSLLESAGAGQALSGIVLLSDGHDFELINPARTALNASARQVPIFAIPLGEDGRVRDAAVRIANYQPYVFTGQRARIDVVLRLIGCEYEDFLLELYRDGERVESKRVTVSQEPQRLESFTVQEEEPGQYAYEVRLSTVAGEVNLENNRAFTFLNVSNKKINLLLLEGSPYWDTNFTQRSLWENDKFQIDAVTSIAPNRLRALRKDASLGELKIPQTAEAFDAYDAVILGRSVERLLDEAALGELVRYVQEFGGNTVFLRHNPIDRPSPLDDIAPIRWGDADAGFAALEVDSRGGSNAAFRLLQSHTGQPTLRPLLAVADAYDAKPLTTVLARAQVSGRGEGTPTMVHRRAGAGQVLSIGGTGFWRTAFHPGMSSGNTLFDQFWDNLILWLISARNVASEETFSVLLNTANLALGEQLHIRLSARDPEALPAGVPVEIFREGTPEPVGNVVLNAAENAVRLTGTFEPKQSGIYQATIALPDGSSDTLQFAVFEDDLERTEVAPDFGYLEALTTHSGGRLVEPAELGELVRNLLHRPDPEPIVRREPWWDLPILAFAIVGFLGMDWLLRRRWGLC